MITMRLENWTLAEDNEEGAILTGNVFDCPYFLDGEFIKSSRIIGARENVARNRGYFI